MSMVSKLSLGAYDKLLHIIFVKGDVKEGEVKKGGRGEWGGG